MYFEIPGEPQGKARARTVRLKSGFVHSFTPEKTASYESLVKLCFRDAAGPDYTPAAGQYSLDVVCYFQPPQNKSRLWKYKALTMKVIRPTKKPDLDNVLKIVADSLCRVAYLDDAAIVEARARKYFDNRPRVEITLELMTT